MKTQRVVFRSFLPFSAETVYRWHTRPGAFERLTPPWEKVRVVEQRGGIEDGGEVVLAIRAAGRWRRWVARHHGQQPHQQFCDTQVEGPFASWEHCHRFLPGGPSQCCLEDNIEYALPGGWLGRKLAGPFVYRKLERMFRYRHAITSNDLALHEKYAANQSLKILVTGSTGLIGSALVPFLRAGGHRVIRLVRSVSLTGSDMAHWNPAEGRLDPACLEGLDAIVHLGGENIAARRWSAEQKARIRSSRVEPTKLLCDTLARLKQPPRTLVAASAIGYYGNRGDSWLDESSGAGEGFLPGVCREWEEATASARKAGVRVVNLRLGLVLTPAGGVLPRMLTPFRMGIGGKIGTGNQYMSWIALDDVLGSLYHALATAELTGPVNAVAPASLSNRDFTKTLGRVLRRPTLCPVPAFAARLAFGEMANELLLTSTLVSPAALLGSGYQFLFPHLESALHHLLGREGSCSEGTSAATERCLAESVVGKAG